MDQFHVPSGYCKEKNFDYITYSTPNTGAYELSDKELQDNKALFPDMDSPAMKKQ